jgi:hypothetical protein
MHTHGNISNSGTGINRADIAITTVLLILGGGEPGCITEFLAMQQQYSKRISNNKYVKLNINILLEFVELFKLYLQRF